MVGVRARPVVAGPDLQDYPHPSGVIMSRIIGLAVVALAFLAPLGAAASARAAAPAPFSITEQVNFETGFNTFTATGPLCPSDTFVDDVQLFAGHPDTTDSV